jgi:hypothetical protein
MSLEVLAVTEMKDECFFHGCAQPVIGAASYHSREEHDVVIVWLCAEHAARFGTPPDATTDVLVQEVSRTCRRTEENGALCGAYATHVVITGENWRAGPKAEIRLVSSCARHAEEAGH